MPALADLRGAETPVAGVRALIRSMLRCAYGIEAPPAGETSRLDLRAYDAALRVLDELDVFAALGEQVHAEEVIAALERAEVRVASANEPGCVAVVDLLRARTRRFEVVFVLGLEEGSLPRRARTSPFLDDDGRRELGGRLERPDQVSRDRYLFYTACTRATRRLYLVREAATDEGGPREPSPFWEEVAAVFADEDVARATLRRPLSALTWPLEAAPTDRERLRALAQRLGGDPDGARAVAEANGWGRRLARARSALQRETRLTSDVLLRGLRRQDDVRRDRARALRRLLVGLAVRARHLAEDDRRRGRPAAARLRRAQCSVHVLRGPAEGARTRSSHTRERRAAVGFLRRCLDDALRGGVRLDLTDLQEAELDESLFRDLEGFVRDEAASPLQFVPRRFEVSFGSDRSAPELQRGLAARRRSLPERQDRPDRHRSVQRSRDRAGLQVGPQRALGEADRRGAEAPDPALHARAARPRRHRAARRRLPRARRCAGHAWAAARRRGRRPARVPAQRLPRRRRVLVAGRDRAGAWPRVRAAHPGR